MFKQHRVIIAASYSLLIVAIVMCVQALWLPAKAWLAHELIRYSWQQNQQEHSQPVRPMALGRTHSQ